MDKSHLSMSTSTLASPSILSRLITCRSASRLASAASFLSLVTCFSASLRACPSSCLRLETCFSASLLASSLAALAWTEIRNQKQKEIPCKSCSTRFFPSPKFESKLKKLKQLGLKFWRAAAEFPEYIPASVVGLRFFLLRTRPGTCPNVLKIPRPGPPSENGIRGWGSGFTVP